MSSLVFSSVSVLWFNWAVPAITFSSSCSNDITMYLKHRSRSSFLGKVLMWDLKSQSTSLFPATDINKWELGEAGICERPSLSTFPRGLGIASGLCSDRLRCALLADDKLVATWCYSLNSKKMQSIAPLHGLRVLRLRRGPRPPWHNFSAFSLAFNPHGSF